MAKQIKMEIDEGVQHLTFITRYCLPDVFIGSKPKIYYQIFQENQIPWNYTILASFLNELTYFTKNPQNSCILSKKIKRE